MRKEEELMAKIRGMRKDRNRMRGNRRGNPTRKKLKLDEEVEYGMSKVMPNCTEKVNTTSVKRQFATEIEASKPDRQPPEKKQRKMLEYFTKSRCEGAINMAKGMPDCTALVEYREHKEIITEMKA